MKGILSAAQKEYVLFHLGHHIHLTSDIRSKLSFVKNPAEVGSLSARIIFYESENELNEKTIPYADGLPILFPCSAQNDTFFLDDAGNLIFHHDILKSIFYLLSGYQEYANPNSSDALNRFSLTDSIQYKMNWIDKPLVNYYFSKVTEAIEHYCSMHHIKLTRKDLFQNFGFILSHDIDSIDLYTLHFIAYKLKEILGLKPSRLSTSANVKLLVRAIAKHLGIIRNDNPHWNFSFMRQLERDHGFRSVFYFLDQGVRHSDAYYSFSESRMINLFQFLREERCEIGLHGTVESITDEEKMRQSLSKLAHSSQASITGIRQHRLLWKHPTTAIIQKAVGLKYDTTLGFAAHEGFRNSYCWPFKLYDFKNDGMIDLWEFPLNIMDVTLFAYRNYTPEMALKKSKAIISEVKKFGGLLSILWHNSFFDEETYPGVTNFYNTLLQEVAKNNPENLLGIELLNKLEDFNSPHE
jgi:hypothetical protein